MIVSGEPIGAEEAHRAGLLDELVEGDLTAAAVRSPSACWPSAGPSARSATSTTRWRRHEASRRSSPEFRESVARQTRGFRAPQRCIQAVEAAVELPFAEGLRRERELFLELVARRSPRRSATSSSPSARRRRSPTSPRTPRPRVKKAAVIGAGTMGGGIAMNFANAGIPVGGRGRREALDRASTSSARTTRRPRTGQATPADVERRMALITGPPTSGRLPTPTS